MNKLLSATALVALLAAAPVYAEDTMATDQTQVEQPAMGADSNAAVPADQMPANQMAPADQMAPATAATDQTNSASTNMMADQEMNAGPGFIQNQAETQLLATALIGQTVYNGADENLGDINDVLIDTGGQTLAVIIGVGGFLGIGEKNVAVPYQAIDTNQDSDGHLRLVLNVDRKALEDAPEFVRLQDQPDTTTTSSTTTTDDTVAPTDSTPDAIAPTDTAPNTMAPADTTAN